MIVATAGHVDHGKTSLVRALTGVETDRLPQEKARGMSIELGYAFRDANASVIGFIDVPGHERFVHTMVSGVSGIDHALLVVAVDDGPMPQTLEHLAILDLLGVPELTLVLNKCDRVDEERVQWVRAETVEIISRSRVRLAATFAVSSLTGAGIEGLWAHLVAREAEHLTDASRSTGGFRMAIDRSFTAHGAGCVVTGTVFAGQVSVGDRIAIAPRGTAARVRSLRVQGGMADRAGPGVRCALNLVGPDVSAASIERGEWVVDPKLIHSTDRLDVCLRLSAGLGALRQGVRVHVLLAAKACTGRLVPLQADDDDLPRSPDQPGAADAGFLAQLVLDERISAVWGDRLIVRDWSARHTIGGGFVVDPFATKRARDRSSRRAVLSALRHADPADALRMCLEAQPCGVDIDAFCRARNLLDAPREVLLRTLSPVMVRRGAAVIAHDPTRWNEVCDAVLAAVAQWHVRLPTVWGPTEAELAAALAPRWDVRTVRDAMSALLERSMLSRTRAWLCLPTHTVRLDARDERLWRRLRDQLCVHAPCPVSAPRLALETGAVVSQAESLLQHVADLGLVIPLADRRYVLAESIERLAQVAQLLTEHHTGDGFSVSLFRDASGVGRKFCINVLEYFDRNGLTRRQDERRWWVGKSPPSMATPPHVRPARTLDSRFSQEESRPRWGARTSTPSGGAPRVSQGSTPNSSATFMGRP